MTSSSTARRTAGPRKFRRRKPPGEEAVRPKRGRLPPGRTRGHRIKGGATRNVAHPRRSPPGDPVASTLQDSGGAHRNLLDYGEDLRPCGPDGPASRDLLQLGETQEAGQRTIISMATSALRRKQGLQPRADKVQELATAIRLELA